MTLVGVVVAGAIGAVCRFVLDHVARRVVRPDLPAGTFAVNVLGSIGAGVLLGLALGRGVDEQVRVVVGSGFLAAFTTFSTFALETADLRADRSVRAAAVYLVASVAIAGVGAGAGFAVGLRL